MHIHPERSAAAPIQHTCVPQLSKRCFTPSRVKKGHEQPYIRLGRALPGGLAQTSALPSSLRASEVVDRGLQCGLKASSVQPARNRAHSTSFSKYLLIVVTPLYPLLLRAGRPGGSHVCEDRNLHGGPVVETLCSQCRGLRFDPWSGN